MTSAEIMRKIEEYAAAYADSEIAIYTNRPAVARRHYERSKAILTEIETAIRLKDPGFTQVGEQG